MNLNKLTTGISVATVATALQLLSGVNPATAIGITGLDTQNNLVFFDSTNPGVIVNSVSITGLQANEFLFGIDYRPATSQLFGIGSTSVLYQIDPFTGVASAIGSSFPSVIGNALGVDFNPVPDRLRVVSNAGQNLRLNPNDGTGVADGNLAYATGDANVGQPANIAAVAYSNNVAGATTTTLYGIDTALDILVIQNPPNAGLLNTVGALGVNFTNLAGFDIFTQNGIDAAFASTGSSLYSINLGTGAATLIGDIGGGTNLRDIAVTPVPEPTTMAGAFLGGSAIAVFRRRRLKSAE